MSTYVIKINGDGLEHVVKQTTEGVITNEVELNRDKLVERYEELVRAVALIADDIDGYDNATYEQKSK